MTARSGGMGGLGLVLAIPLLIEVFQVAELAEDGTFSITGDLPLWATLYGALRAVLGYAVLTFASPALAAGQLAAHRRGGEPPHSRRVERPPGGRLGR